MTKVKLHLLTHLHEDIRCFGPLVGVSTEIYECYNAIFHMCLIYSNKLAPSCDIAIQFAEMEGAKQHISGGFWRNVKGFWVQSSPAAHLFFSTAKELQCQLGWVIEPAFKPGIIY